MGTLRGIGGLAFSLLLTSFLAAQAAPPAQPAWPTLKQILDRSVPNDPGEHFDFIRGAAADQKSRERRWKETDEKGQRVEHVERRQLIVNWFVGPMAIYYSVNDSGKLLTYRHHQLAVQATHNRVLTAEERAKLTELLAKLPASKAEPPLDHAVLVSFQRGQEWRIETYDARSLPPEFEQVLLVLGERSETKDRHAKAAKP